MKKTVIIEKMPIHHGTPETADRIDQELLAAIENAVEFIEKETIARSITKKDFQHFTAGTGGNHVWISQHLDGKVLERIILVRFEEIN